MRLDWAIPCLSVRVEDDGRVSLMENFGFDGITVPELPAEVELIALIRAVGQPEEFDENADRSVVIELKGPDLEDLLTVEFEVRAAAPGPNHPEGWELSTMIPVLLQFTAQGEGAHSINFSIQGRVQRPSIPLNVTLESTQSD